jgi:hypothetical protein
MARRRPRWRKPMALVLRLALAGLIVAAVTALAAFSLSS